MTTTDLDSSEPSQVSLLPALRTWLIRYQVPLAAFVVSRIGLVIIVYASVLMLPVRTDNRPRSFPDNLFLDGWVRWDSFYYRDIAVRGYTHVPSPEGGFADTNFFPLYPLAARLVGAPFQSVEIGGLIVSNVAFLGALLLLYQFVTDHYGEGVAKRTVLLLAFNPMAYVFSAMYTESLYLLFAIATFTFAERNRWGPAAVFAAFAGATRVPGITILIGLGVLYMEKMRTQGKWLDRRVLWFLLGACGTGAVLLFFQLQFGDAFAFRQNHDGRDFFTGMEGLWNTFTRLVQPALLVRGEVNISQATHAIALLLMLLLLAKVARVFPKGYSVWIILTIIASMQVWWGGFGRFALPLFPLFVAAALLLKKPSLFQPVLYLSAMLMTLFAIVFASWNWIT